jgi:hypothetical protein
MKRTLGIFLLAVWIASPAHAADTASKTPAPKTSPKSRAGQGGAAADQMYRWVDRQGKVHYGDTVPPEYAGQATKVLTGTGRVIKETGPALTPEQIQARADAEARDKEARDKATEQKRRDAALLASYTSLGEIDLAEKRNLEAVDLQIKSNELRIKSVQGRLDGLKKQEARITERKKPVPEDLTRDIEHAEAEILHLKENIAKAEQEKDALRSRYAVDRKRYAELKGLAEPSPAPTSTGPASK